MSDDDKKKSRSRKPYGSLPSRVMKLENSIEEIKDLLEPSEMKVVFYNPYLGNPEPEPDPDELPKGHIIVRFISPYEIKDPDPEMEKNLAAEREEVLAKAEADRRAGIDQKTRYEPSSKPAQAGIDSQPSECVTAEGYGWRWGVQPPIQHRFKDKNVHRGMQILSRNGII